MTTAKTTDLPNTVPDVGEMDVVCGRGKLCHSHPGNRYFRSLIEANLEEFKKASSKVEKSIVVSQIVNAVREKGDFYRQDSTTKNWYQVSDRVAREKTGAHLRDALSDQYKSSSQAKRKRRKVESIQEHEELKKFIAKNAEITAMMTNLTRTVSDDLPDKHVLNLFEQTQAAMLTELKRSESGYQFQTQLRRSVSEGGVAQATKRKAQTDAPEDEVIPCAPTMKRAVTMNDDDIKKRCFV
uniref:DUF6824 domain-containing protein n=1 Tax=Grammatophora oceanica TaxID=210454 RepID=A0A7S1YNN8_9STRA|mmetsp:Transcript_9631/g.14147  ORF Transcript_9631/g.14147 Transcript_9631/m.14147 type:complete len:240 (+) Transcript_9631:77-796(+)